MDSARPNLAHCLAPLACLRGENGWAVPCLLAPRARALGAVTAWSWRRGYCGLIGGEFSVQSSWTAWGWQRGGVEQGLDGSSKTTAS
jgi:hypothetical protein